MADVMVRFTDNNVATRFLSEEEIKERCPLAYAENPTNKVSDKYIVANTATVIRDMETLGWKVVEAKQRKGQKNSSGRFSYHMVVFQNPEVKITNHVEGEETETIDCFPRIILTNSHDGLNCFKFMVGIYRLVCSNGLVIASDEYANLKIRHINYTFEELRALTQKVIQDLPAKVELMNQMKHHNLSIEQMHDMAHKMYDIRKGSDLEETEEVVSTVDDQTLNDMLAPNREEDKGRDLWTVFNVLQEKVIRGGYTYFEEGMKKPRKMRKITSFVKDLDINQKMFEIAKSYLPVNAVA